jgi:acyl carrier protein
MRRGEETEARVRAIVSRLSKRRDPDALAVDADVYRELGIVSSAALDLLLTLEEDLCVQLPDVEFNDARTIAAMVALVERRRGN